VSRRRWVVPLLCAGALMAGCATDPMLTRDTPYEGNVAPLDYRHVSGAPVPRNATREMAGMVAQATVLNVAVGTAPTMAGSSPATQSVLAGRSTASTSSGLLRCRNGDEWTR